MTLPPSASSPESRIESPLDILDKYTYIQYIKAYAKSQRTHQTPKWVEEYGIALEIKKQHENQNIDEIMRKARESPEYQQQRTALIASQEREEIIKQSIIIFGSLIAFIIFVVFILHLKKRYMLKTFTIFGVEFHIFQRLVALIAGLFILFFQIRYSMDYGFGGLTFVFSILVSCGLIMFSMHGVQKKI